MENENDSLSYVLGIIGIQLKNDSGEIKSLDTILNEINEKWQELSEENKGD